MTRNYDARGRLTSMVDGEGKTWSSTHDDEGVLTSSSNPLGQTWTMTSDKQGRIKSVSDPLSNQTRSDYDELSRMISSTNALNQTTSYDYEERGLLNQVSQPGPTTASYQRNGLGQVTEIADPRGKARRWTYDKMGRLTARIDALGIATRVERYDERNRPARIDLPLSTLNLSYDGIGLITQRSYSDGTNLDFTYDAANRLTSATGVALGYDAANRLSSSNGIIITRDDGGRIASLELEPGKRVTYSYDRRNLLTSVTDWLGGVTRFAYDDAGRLTSIARPNGVVTTYRYDAADRLTGISETRGESVFSTIALTRDAVGQTREATREVPLAATPLPGNRTQTYNDADQIAGFSYDKMGRLTNDGVRAYTWDLASRLTSYTDGLSTVSFTYDASGNRLSRSEAGRTRSYVWNYALGLPSVSIIKDEGKTTRYYIHTPDGALLYSVEAESNARRFYHYDEMGSTLCLTDDSGAITDRYAYTPYGELTGSSGTTDNQFTYIGKWGVMHEGTLYYMRARYYDSTTGRFISWDPLGENLLDVKSLNLYHYAAQNPLGFIDPMGLDGQSPRGTRSIFGREELREERFSLRSELWDLGDKLEHLEDASIAALGGFVGALNTTPTEYVGMSNFSSNPDYLPSLGAFVAGYDNETVSNWIKDDQLFFYNQAAAIGAQLPQLRAERQRVRERLESLEDLQRLLYPDDYQRDIPLEQFLNPNPFAGSLPQAVPNSSRQTQQSPKPCLFGGIRLSVPGIPDDPNYPGVDEIIN